MWVTSLLGVALALVVVVVRAYDPSGKEIKPENDGTAVCGSELSRKGLREVAKKKTLKAKFDKQAALKAAGGGLEGEAQGEVALHTSKSIPRGNFETGTWMRTDLNVALPEDYDLSEQGWRLELVCGDAKRTITLKDIEALPGYGRYEDVPWHCVTGWSKLGLAFHGAPVKQVLALLSPDGAAASLNWKFVLQTSADGYTCPLYREDVEGASAFFAVKDGEGALLSQLHGGPRLLMPQVWGWKSAKWMTKLELSETYTAGFWESITSHPRGRICDADGVPVEERWASGAATGFASYALTASINIIHTLFGPKAYYVVHNFGGFFAGKVGMFLLASKKPKQG
jgi:DMSO/TMAO reductase YedYZ molybdopterin-dependent catalytic subunit